MKKLFLAGMVLSVATMGFAAPEKSEEVKAEMAKKAGNKSTSTSTLGQAGLDKTSIHKGLKLSIGTSNQKFEFEAKGGGGSISDDVSGDAIGMSIGYQKLNIAQMGYSVDLTHMSYEPEKSDAKLSFIGIEGNLNYGINDKLYTYGGLNLSNISVDGISSDSSDFYDDFGTGAGIQLAMGYQFQKNIAAEIKYKGTSFSQTRTTSGTDIDYTVSTRGTQISLIGTF